MQYIKVDMHTSSFKSCYLQRNISKRLYPLSLQNRGLQRLKSTVGELSKQSLVTLRKILK